MLHLTVIKNANQLLSFFLVVLILTLTGNEAIARRKQGIPALILLTKAYVCLKPGPRLTMFPCSWLLYFITVENQNCNV